MNCNKSFKKLVVLLLALTSMNVLFAQPIERFIKVVVAADHSDWTYKKGEKVKFTISVYKNGNLLNDVKVRYEIGLEKQDPIKKDSLILSTGTQTIDAGTINEPGFLRCIAVAVIENKEYRNLSTAAFDPLQIVPTVENPKDFNEFWQNAILENAKIPMDAKMTLMPDKCTEKVNVYHLSLQNYRIGTRLYGILCVPKKEGKYPALLQVPGAGVRAYSGDIANAEKGIITLQIGIHGIPVNMDPSVYLDLANGILNGYPNYNLDNRDRFFYKRVYVGCIRANDFLTSMPQFDGINLAVTGGSQGGALSIVTAALDSRVKCLGVFYPALCDVTGYLNGRAGGWPHYFDKYNKQFNDTKEKLQTVPYYDVVNFAKRIKVPGFYSWGYNDEVCPPTSMYSAYNSIVATKELFLALETGHWSYPEQNEKMNNWLLAKLKSN